jgi:hypothetical protein
MGDSGGGGASVRWGLRQVRTQEIALERDGRVLILYSTY